MKRFIVLVLGLFMFGACTSERADWDSGGDATRAQQQQQEEERVEAVRDPVLSPGQGISEPSHRREPF
jgi:PBP1b-binding outer membrane lipoprotein LpoB